MVQLTGDDPSCEPYSGIYKATLVFVAGQGTEQEQVFLRSHKSEAITYANAYDVPLSKLVSVKSLCHDRVVELLGA